MDFIYSSSFYVYLAFFIVIGILVFKGRNAILGGAYERINRIKEDIAAAERLRTDAQELLAQQEKQFRENVEYAKQLIVDAREKSELITAQAQKKSEDIIARAEERAEKSIQRAEEEARIELQNQAVDKAFNIVQDIALKQGVDSSLQSALDDIKKFK